MVVYVSGPYRGDVEQNVARAREVAVILWDLGLSVICPHLNTFGIELDTVLSHEDFVQLDLQQVERCDAIVMIPEWETSEGARIEREHAESCGIPIVYWPEWPIVPPTEVFQPVQCRAFIQTVMSFYRLHLLKNEDYSPSNILATGETGIVTRLWDKVARLMNLSGFQFHIDDSKFWLPRTPKNEVIEDTYRDLSVYGIIGLIYRMGKWGR